MPKLNEVRLAHAMVEFDALDKTSKRLVKAFVKEIQAASGVKRKKRKYTRHAKTNATPAKVEKALKVVKAATAKAKMKAPVKVTKVAIKRPAPAPAAPIESGDIEV